MKNKKIILYLLTLAFLMLALNVRDTLAQPSDAQLKKQLTSPKTVSITLNGQGKIEWSKTYKKYMWTRYFTARLKTDTPGEIQVFKGYAAYDVMGGRYVFWRTFGSTDGYEGKKNLTVAEINQALQTLDNIREFTNHQPFNIGEFESFKIAADPDWEWHTPDSVSFNVVAVYRIVNSGGRYDDGEWYQPPSGSKAIDKVESVMRLRLYRKGANLPWSGVGVSHKIRHPQDKRYLKEVKRLLSREVLPEAQVERMPRMSKVPQLSQ